MEKITNYLIEPKVTICAQFAKMENEAAAGIETGRNNCKKTTGV